MVPVKSESCKIQPDAQGRRPSVRLSDNGKSDGGVSQISVSTSVHVELGLLRHKTTTSFAVTTNLARHPPTFLHSVRWLAQLNGMLPVFHQTAESENNAANGPRMLCKVGTLNWMTTRECICSVGYYACCRTRCGATIAMQTLSCGGCVVTMLVGCRHR